MMKEPIFRPKTLDELIGHEPPKNIEQIIRESMKLDAPFQHFSTVMIQDKNEIIKGISTSRRNNLILNNFGILLAEMFTTPSQTQSTATLTDILNAATVVQFYGDNTADDYSFSTNIGANVGTLVQVGAGTTPAARADYAIETPFIVAPEDDLFNTGPGSYGAGSIGVSATIVAGGNGTIAETLLVMQLTQDDLNPADVAFFHDLLASTEAFVIGETITVTYTINL